jgi:hypothetical protein
LDYHDAWMRRKMSKLGQSKWQRRTVSINHNNTIN